MNILFFADLHNDKFKELEECLGRIWSSFISARNIVYERAMFGLRNHLEDKSIEHILSQFPTFYQNIVNMEIYVITWYVII